MPSINDIFASLPRSIGHHSKFSTAKSRASFSLYETKASDKPNTEETRADTVSEHAVPIASLQLINSIREQKEKSGQLQQQKRKSPRDQ